jgi:Amt family ammonium transporter
MKGVIKKSILVAVLITLISGYAKAASENGVDTGITPGCLPSTALVLLMIPGLAMFYGGLVRTKNVLGTMMHSFVAMGVMAVPMGGGRLLDELWQQYTSVAGLDGTMTISF